MLKNNPSSIHEVLGTIVLAQEDRFRVQTKDGQSLLIGLGRGSGADIEDLESMAGSGKMVRVLYQGEPDAGAIALRVSLASGNGP